MITQPTETPRSYAVSTPTGSTRRNRQHLIAVPESHSDHNITNMPEQTIAVQPPPTDIQTTRSGRLSVPPHRLISDPDWNT